MFPGRPSFSTLLPLLLAVGLLLAIPLIRPLVLLEHRAFPAPERFQKETFFIDDGDPGDFQLEVFRFKAGETRPANIGTYVIDGETREIMGPNGGDPVEWAQFLRQTRLPDDRLVVVTSSLSWPEARELPLRALQEQVELTPGLVVGLRAELLNQPGPLPPELGNSVIPGPLPDGFTPTGVDHLLAPPSITAPLFGISGVRGLKIEEKGGKIRIPLLVRWGPHLLPSLQLASLMTIHGVPPSEVIIDPAGYLRLGETGPALRLDPSGFTWIEQSESERQSASQLQIYPTRAETMKIISADDRPRQITHLASQIQDLLAHSPSLVKSYRRWPLALEIGGLIFLALVLPTRRFWFPLTLLFLIPALSLVCSRWFPASPLLLLFLLHLILRWRDPGNKSSKRVLKS